MSTFADRVFGEGEIHDILRNERRRRVLRQLRSTTRTLTLRELAETIASKEAGVSPPPTPLRESVYNSLHQTHLPRLDRQGVITYDANRKTVSLRPRARELDVYMEVVTPYGMTWAGYYRALGTLALLCVVAVEVHVPILDTIPVLLVASLFLAAFSVSGAYQFWTRRYVHLRSLLD